MFEIATHFRNCLSWFSDKRYVWAILHNYLIPVSSSLKIIVTESGVKTNCDAVYNTRMRPGVCVRYTVMRQHTVVL